MLDRARLALIRDGGVLINTSRGALVDHSALTDELVSGRLHAVLDVTEPEPLPAGSPLYRLPNVFLTPISPAPSETSWNGSAASSSRSWNGLPTDGLSPTKYGTLTWPGWRDPQVRPLADASCHGDGRGCPQADPPGGPLGYGSRTDGAGPLPC